MWLGGTDEEDEEAPEGWGVEGRGGGGGGCWPVGPREQLSRVSSLYSFLAAISFSLSVSVRRELHNDGPVPAVGCRLGTHAVGPVNHVVGQLHVHCSCHRLGDVICLLVF